MLLRLPLGMVYLKDIQREDAHGVLAVDMYMAEKIFYSERHCWLKIQGLGGGK